MVQYSMASPKPEDMRKCPFCARMIRKTARKCPFCNQTLPSDSTQRSASSVTAVPNEKSRRIFFGGLGMIIFILAFSAVFVWLGNETGRSPGFLFPLIFIQGIFVLCILLFFLASKIRPAILDVKPSGFIERVESIRFDNYFFLLAREFVYWLDNKIFNHNGRAGYGYHPTRFSLVVPFWLSLFTCVIHFLRSLSWRGSFDDPYRIIMTCMPVLLGNLLFCCKNVLFFSDRIRQICYPIFIGICSLGFFLLIFTIGWWLSSYAWIVLLVLVLMTSGGGSPSSLPRHSSPPSNDGEEYTEEMSLFNGSVMPTRLTRKGGIGDWHGNDGHTYTEDSEGRIHRK